MADQFASVRSRTRVAALLFGAAALSSMAWDGVWAQSSAPLTASGSQRVTDPGVRGGEPGGGAALSGLSDAERQLFAIAKEVFDEPEGVPDGLGPRFNLDSCGGCHAQPTTGGTSPKVNPQVAMATKDGGKNVVPSFIRANGPVREARFVRNRDGSADGGVHALFVTTGMKGAPAGCNIRQPDFAGELARNNVIFRIPTPVFGLGLVELVSDATLEASMTANSALKRTFGITGRFNRSGNDGSIARFGWKAQNKSLMIFSGEAYNVEMGITNELFPNERQNDPIGNCAFVADPDSPIPAESQELGSPLADYASDATLFTAFMRLSAPPAPGPQNASTSRGRQVFTTIGCAACHTVSFNTGNAALTGQSNVTISPFSDFALHDMGDGLADGISQGNANGREFRTAPLWGVGQRIFFLHDGRTDDLNEAIRQHASQGSEANAVVRIYNLLPAEERQALVNFLRSL
jgi:CxxC motif-containing protein (DUF1111 family)